MAIFDPLDENSNGTTSQPRTGGVTGNAGATTTPPIQNTDARSGIASAYKSYLGRDPQEYEYGFWSGNPNYTQGIQSSPEAQAFAKGQSYRPTYNAFEGVDQHKLNDPTHTSVKYTAARILAAGGNVQQAAQAVGGTVIDGTRFRLPSGEVIDTRRDEEGANALQWLVLGNDANAGNNYTSQPQIYGNTGGGGYGKMGEAGSPPSAQGSVFSDPGTSQWEQMLRAYVDRLNTRIPQDQLELQQTQALDPLERQRQQQKQQMALQLSQRGIAQGSGVYNDAMQNIDRQFNELRTRTQAGFANAAAQQQEQRQGQAVNTMFQIPQYQDTRLALANGTMQQLNPIQLLNMSQQNQQYNNAQNQQFFQWLGNALANYFG